MSTTTAATDTRHIRALLPLGLIRDLQPARHGRLPPPPEPPSALKVAIVRWLNEEL